jgi:hypothetical protein
LLVTRSDFTPPLATPHKDRAGPRWQNTWLGIQGRGDDEERAAKDKYALAVPEIGSEEFGAFHW